MSLRTCVLGLVEVVLRVPPLFVIDEILKIGLGVSELADSDFGELGAHDSIENVGVPQAGDSLIESFNYTGTIHYNSKVYRFVLFSLLRVLLSTLGCLSALCLFVLSTKHLMVVYMYLMSLGIVFVSYWTNVSTMRTVVGAIQSQELKSSILEEILSLNFDQLTQFQGCTVYVGQNILFQLSMMFLFFNIRLGPRYPTCQRLLPLSFVGPSILAVLPLPISVLNHAAVFAALMPLVMVLFVLGSSVFPIAQTVYHGYIYARSYVSNFGMSALVESEWLRLSVPEVLRTFWLLRMLEHTGLFFISGLWQMDDAGMTPAFKLMKNTMITGCDTLIAVLGITSIVSYLCHHIGKFFQWILLTQDENDKGIGAVSAILFYILALQTGLTGLDPEKRFVRLCRNFCLLFTALLHFIHNIVSPLLMSLSASHNPSLKRHIRALSVCGFLVLFPIMLMTYLWSNHTISTWLLAVSAFSVEVIVKVAVSLCIYSIFLLDARRDTFWERLDDYVYYIRAFGNTVEFCFGIFLFFNGAWILVFESGGAIRAVMMCIHAYFNIWCEAKAGWSVFMKRRTAVNKIDSLPEAATEQLERLDDVCAICYQEMKSAKITRCKHFFHGVCLRKWLYVQDRCPLCHEILHSVEFDQKSEEEDQHPVPEEEIFDDYR